MEHHCNKEKEIAEMAIKIDNIEKTVGEIKQDQKAMLTEIKELFQTVATTYATKDELAEVKKEVKKNASWVTDHLGVVVICSTILIAGIIFINKFLG